MKIAILGDSHFGVRSDKPAFHKFFKKFYQECFFPYLWDNNIEHVIQTGDLFDRRKFVNYNTLYQSKRYFFNEFKKGKLKLHVYPGNHDIYYKNSLRVNSIQGNLRSYIESGAIECYINPTTVMFDGTAIDFIPWICEENQNEIKEFIAKTKSQICIGHFELDGFETEKGHVHTGGMKREELQKYEIAMSGHFHHRSTDGHIWYVGSPCEHTWGDYGDTKGFHIFDTSKRDLQFIANPWTIHHKVVYNDTNLTLQEVQSNGVGNLEGMIVKVVIENKANPVIFDLFMDKVYETNPLEVKIVENFTFTDDVSLNQADDTVSLIYKTVDALEIGEGMDKEKIKGYLREIYQEAEAYAD